MKNFNNTSPLLFEAFTNTQKYILYSLIGVLLILIIVLFIFIFKNLFFENSEKSSKKSSSKSKKTNRFSDYIDDDLDRPSEKNDYYDESVDDDLMQRAKAVGIKDPESFSKNRLEQLIMIKEMQGPVEISSRSSSANQDLNFTDIINNKKNATNYNDNFDYRNNQTKGFDQEQLLATLEERIVSKFDKILELSDIHNKNLTKKNDNKSLNQAEQNLLKTIESQLESINKRLSLAEETMQSNILGPVSNEPAKEATKNQKTENQELKTLEIEIGLLDDLIKKHSKEQ